MLVIPVTSRISKPLGSVITGISVIPVISFAIALLLFDPNAKLETQRASGLSGSLSEATGRFETSPSLKLVTSASQFWKISLPGQFISSAAGGRRP